MGLQTGSFCAEWLAVSYWHGVIGKRIYMFRFLIVLSLLNLSHFHLKLKIDLQKKINTLMM